MVYIHNEISLIHKKEQNCGIYRDMDGPRDCHTELSQKVKKKILYSVIYMWNLIEMNLFAKQKQRHRHTEQRYGYQWGKWGSNELRVWG